MSLLKNLETRIAGVVEGTFSRVFRSEVRPIEIARRLAREMEDHQSQSLAHVYVPNEYQVFLSERDRSRFRDYEQVLGSELSAYLLEHARREGFTLPAPPEIDFETDPRLGLGQFGIQTRTAVPPRQRPPVRSRDDAEIGRTMVASSAARTVEPLQAAAESRSQRAVLRYAGRELAIGPDGATIGRSRQCDIVVGDPNVSRRHAQVAARGGSWVVTDLGSTNGTRLNGVVVRRAEVVRAGDRIEVGDGVIEFDLE
jgi:hypothetical protein